MHAGQPRAGLLDASSWSPIAPWLMGLVVVLALALTSFTYDLLQNRLQESSARFNAALRRFERFWVLYDSTVESTLALKWDLSAAAPGSAGATLDPDVRRFALTTAALLREALQPGMLGGPQVETFAQAARHLQGLLGLPGGAPSAASAPMASNDLGSAAETIARSVPLARQQVQQVLERLALMGQEARQRDSLSEVFRAEVEDVRRQVLVAVAGLVAMLVLFGVVAAQWTIVARREAAIRRRAEGLAALAQSESARAEEVARDKARFLGMLSHELLTPLQSLWSTVDLIESRGRVEAGDPAFSRLKESTRSLRGRISDLVDFAKMSSGRLETRVRGFQMDKLVDTALRDVAESLAARNLDVHWEATPELARRICADPARLRQVLDNLLTNAIKYTERGGISIHAELLGETSRLRLEVADTGVGIRPEDVDRLFEPFYRAPSTAAMAEGSGLGLAVVRSLIDLMGGTIRVHSRLGHGTCVVVEVPFTTLLDDDSAPPEVLDAGLPVLVADDAPEARRAIADVLRAQGLEVFEADSGAAALSAAAERRYLAIILDMQMPGLDGAGVARALRAPGQRNAGTFLALVSACNDAPPELAPGLFDMHVDKPAGQADLMSVMAQAARRFRALAPG